MENDTLKLYFALKNRCKGCCLSPAQMDLGGAGGSRRSVLREWAWSAGWRVGLSVFVWQCSGDALFLKHQERQTYTQQEHKSRDWKFWACLQTLASSLESKLKASWAQPTNSWGVGVCYPKLHRGALVKWSRSYHHHLVLMTYNTFTPNLKISKTNRITGILFTVVVQCCLFKLGLLAVGTLQPDLVKGAEGGPSPSRGHLLEGTPSHLSTSGTSWGPSSTLGICNLGQWVSQHGSASPVTCWKLVRRLKLSAVLWLICRQWTYDSR